ncbi:MAG: transaldolase family protein [Candidatus Bathyarchaeia archaeon]|jgi:hypothetical protein
MVKAEEIGQSATKLSVMSVASSVAHMLQQIEQGRTLAAADHLLVRESRNDLDTVVESLTAQLPNFLIRNQDLAESVFASLIRIGLNLVGQDVKVAQTPAAIVDRALSILKEKTTTLEDSWSDPARHAVNSILVGMSSVNSGDSLPGYMAEKITERLASDIKPSRFIESFATVVRETIYWRMVEGRLCKFGNDYARGLEMLRHIGFSQVSTNPVLAPRAFDEDSTLVQQLEQTISQNPGWKQNPRAHGHNMAMAGTLLALWPNLEVFRPLAVLVDNRDYMISFQLNPNNADDAKASLEDAMRAYGMVQDHLVAYDKCLGLQNPGKALPNLVFKVAGSSKAARQITRELNSAGIGTNNTVTFTVAQEVQLIIDALEGKAKAMKSGKTVTRTYETNMGGRFVSHLRESEALRIILEISRRKSEGEAIQVMMRLAKELNLSGADVERIRRTSGLAPKAEILCAYRNLKSLTHGAFYEAASEAGLDKSQVEELEADLRKAGTLVAKRVYSVFYEKENYGKWVAWVEREHGIQLADAVVLLDSMDLLPASKRIPEDTYDTLGSRNICNTEFPNHAKAVQLYSERSNFELASYREAILRPPDAKLVKRLMEIHEFARGYELTSEISTQLIRAGVLSQTQDLGYGGISEEEWHDFGAVKKTMSEFREAYEKFAERCVKLASTAT